MGKMGSLTNQFMSALGVSKSTFYRWVQEYPDFNEAFQLAKGESASYHENIINMVASGAIKGNIKASEIALKSLDSDTYGKIDPKQEIVLEGHSQLSDDQLQAQIKKYLEQQTQDV